MDAAVGGVGGAVFPAHAGVSPKGLDDVADKTGFPRTRGGEPARGVTTRVAAGFSPHTRG